MPLPTGGKRKRGDRTYSEDNFSRPSPHRPNDLNLAQQGPPQSPSFGRPNGDGRGRGNRRSSRGSRSYQNSPSFNGASDLNHTIPSGPRARTNPPDPAAPNAAASVATPEPQAPVLIEEPVATMRLYNYSHISDDMCQAWSDSGRDQVVTLVSDAQRDRDELQVSELVQELIQSALSGRLPASACGGLLKEVSTSHHAEEDMVDDDNQESNSIQDAVLDAISVVYEDNATIPLSSLGEFILATGISAERLRQEFEASLLEKLGLIRNTFSRMGIRKQTNILYRQANFNLLREESEGFAKLMTELFTTSGNEPPTATVVEETVERVKAMIGAFDLDVGRSLDVVLDVFGAVLVKQFRFFVKFLRASPWWPRPDSLASDQLENSFIGLPDWALPGHSEWQLTEDHKEHVADTLQKRDQAFWPLAKTNGLSAYHELGRVPASAAQIEQARNSNDEEDFTSVWVRETGTLPPAGNRDAAQLLGFKLRFYSSSPARDESDVLPDNLIFLSALLIKIGFISLKDLYPHIWRLDEEMEELRQQKLKEKAERERAGRPGIGAKNALLMAGALPDDTLPVPHRLRETTTRSGTPSKEVESDKTTSKEIVQERADQKVLLLKSLLAIGALPEALFILGRFPWLLDLYPDLSEYVHRILHHSLSRVYDNLQPVPSRESLQAQAPLHESDLPGLPKGEVTISEPPTRKVLRWALLDRDDSNDGTDYRYYWDEWNDNIPVCREVSDVFVLCETLLALVGVKIGQDPGLVSKLARIGRHSLSTDTSEENRARWLDLSKRLLLPSLSLTKPNAGVVNEVFELLNQYPVTTRYIMYLEWSTGRTSRLPDIKVANDQAKAETRDVLKRISKTNVRPMARALAKIAYANPHIVITTALGQIESYDSIAEVFVEGTRYFTDLGYDVLTWALISSMARAGRDRVQEGGIFTSKWLSALANFTGKIYKRYSMMKAGPVLQYVARQLETGSSTELIMLEQLVASMAGIATDTTYNDTQLQAMGGGPLLQAQTILQVLDRRHESKTTSRRLVKALLESRLAGRFVVLMAQQLQNCVFDEADVPLKAVGNTYDEVHRVMGQYLELLRSNLSVDEYAAEVPDVLRLMFDFELAPEVAFWLARPVIQKQLSDYEVPKTESDDARIVNGDLDMADEMEFEEGEEGEAHEVEDGPQVSAPSPDAQLDGPSLELDSLDKPSLSPVRSVNEQWHPALLQIMDGIQSKASEDVIKLIGLGFYVTFWQLSLYDITIPGKSYEDELSRQHKRIAAISADRTDITASGAKKKEAEKKQIQELVDRLLTENKQHLKAFAESKSRLQREKDQWFVGMARQYEALNTALMENCFLPRMLFSPLDAYFCFKLIKFLHSAGTPNFRTVGLFDLLLKPNRLTSLIFACTSKESDNLGRFLNEILKDFARWHQDKALYEREAYGSKRNLTGFATRIENGKAVVLMPFESFRKLLFKWHSNLLQALQNCLTSPEYMHVRNAISILRAVSTVYPVVKTHGIGLQKAVDKLRDSDKEDLKVSSQALLGALHRREKSWIAIEAFKQGSEGKTEVEQKQAATKSEDSNSVQPSAEKTDEDGEVNDTVMTDVAAKVEKDSKESLASGKPQISQTAASESGRSTPRSRATNGNSTPSHRPSEARPSERPESRSTRIDIVKDGGLPRRLSPPRRSQPPANLPSRPETVEPRGHHEDLRQSSRPHSSSRPPAPDLPRPRPDDHTSYPRHDRPDGRAPDPSSTEYERRPRGHERSDHSSRPERESRGYGRDHDRVNHVDRVAQDERDHGRTKERDTPQSRMPNRETPRHDSANATDRRRLPENAREEPRRPNPTSQPGPPTINPERAALINGEGDNRPDMSIRGQAQDSASRQPRPQTPPVDRRAPRHHRDERALQDRHEPLPRSNALMPSPVGPMQHPGSTNFRDSRGPYSQAAPDMQYGRLEQDTSHRPPQPRDQAADADVPSGPRGRGTIPAPRGRGAPMLNTQAASNPFTQHPTPTGPSRHSRTSSYQEPPPPSSAPSTPADTVHPDRLRQIDQSPNEPSRPAQRPVPPPIQAPPPLGPRSNVPMNAPSGPSPTSRAPPTGPHMGDQSARGGRNGRSTLSTVNNTLAQAGQGTLIRGRGGMRPNSGSFAPHMPPSAPGHGTRSEPFQGSQDLFASAQNPNDLPVQPRPQMGRHESNRDPSRREDDRKDFNHPQMRHEYPRQDREPKRGEAGASSEIRNDIGHRNDDSRHINNRREEQPRDDQRNYRSGPRADGNPRKHSRDEGPGPYPGGGRGGRIASDPKRVRRGG